MNDLWFPLPQRPDFWLLLAMPLVAAFVGWLTNWLAVEMTFRPLAFVGLRLGRLRLGWQGIIPAKAGKMAGVVVDNALAKVASLSEMFREMEPERIAWQIAGSMREGMEDYIDAVMREHDAVFWENIPVMVKRRIYARARRQIPDIMEDVIEDMAANIEELVDLRDMVTRMMRENRQLLVRVFREVGEAELAFVVRSGAWFGFLFGLLQAVFYYFFPQGWVMPVFGFLVGYATNWLALNIIFRPQEPVRVGPWRLHGLFMRRRAEVADKFSELSTLEIINLGNVMTEVLTGPQSHRARAIIKRRTRPLLESGVVRSAIQLGMGSAGQSELRNRVADHAVTMTLEVVSDPRFNRERSGIMHGIFRERMMAMSNAEFQELLLPAFKEDEWILIMLGAALGGIAGSLQLLLALSL
ncbi:MAG: hypothetical protein VW625_06115 [Perlucidibaca sp.]